MLRVPDAVRVGGCTRELVSERQGAQRHGQPETLAEQQPDGSAQDRVAGSDLIWVIRSAPSETDKEASALTCTPWPRLLTGRVILDFAVLCSAQLEGRTGGLEIGIEVRVDQGDVFDRPADSDPPNILE
jgi:hypothetical protein